jgi:hypothetical protein
MQIKPGEFTPQELEAIAEFQCKPVGQHSPFLQRLINVMRGEPVEGKYVLLCTKPHREWVLAQMNGRAKPLTVHWNRVFHDLGEAEFEIFKLRYKRHFGKMIPDDQAAGPTSAPS